MPINNPPPPGACMCFCSCLPAPARQMLRARPMSAVQDWSYVAGSCFEITLELSDNKWPPEQGLAALWEDNRQALVDYALWAALGG